MEVERLSPALWQTAAEFGAQGDDESRVQLARVDGSRGEADQEADDHHHGGGQRRVVHVGEVVDAQGVSAEGQGWGVMLL